MIRAAGDAEPAGFRITSPRNGDRFRFVPGVDPAFATVGLRAAGGARNVRWFVDGEPHRAARWTLAIGVHRIRAVSGNAQDEVAIEVLP